MASFITLLMSALLAFNAAQAHPGESHQAESAERAAFVMKSPKSVRSCAAALSARGVAKQSVVRRSEFAQKAQSMQHLTGNRMLARRDFAAYNITHASSKAVDLGSDETTLFEDDSTCILQPEVTQGPYYIDGEVIRADVREDQKGVPLYLDVQIINTATCEPVPALFADLWHANATGVYSGVEANGNGNSNDATNLNKTFLRGIQQTDANGVVQFVTNMPGHYTGRAPHIHILTHNPNSTIVRTNATLLQDSGNFSTSASHVGQLFFDQALLTEVSATEPYASNTQTLTLNSEDQILSSEAADMDPFVEYVLLGDSISDGILAWISVGIDPTIDETISSAGTHYEDGGVANSDSSLVGGSSGGNGTMGGAMPSGSGAPPSSIAP